MSEQNTKVKIRFSSLEHMTSEMSPKGFPIDLYCVLLIFLTIVTKYAQFYSQQTLWGLAGGGVDRAGARKGVVQHSCQALPHNLSRNWKLAKQSAYANTASRHLCLEAVSVRCLRRTLLLRRHRRPTPEAKTSSFFLPRSV